MRITPIVTEYFNHKKEVAKQQQPRTLRYYPRANQNKSRKTSAFPAEFGIQEDQEPESEEEEQGNDSEEEAMAVINAMCNYQLDSDGEEELGLDDWVDILVTQMQGYQEKMLHLPKRRTHLQEVQHQEPRRKSAKRVELFEKKMQERMRARNGNQKNRNSDQKYKNGQKKEYRKSDKQKDSKEQKKQTTHAVVESDNDVNTINHSESDSDFESFINQKKAVPKGQISHIFDAKESTTVAEVEDYEMNVAEDEEEIKISEIRQKILA
jgi:hypothetical protein